MCQDVMQISYYRTFTVRASIDPNSSQYCAHILYCLHEVHLLTKYNACMSLSINSKRHDLKFKIESHFSS